MQYDKNLNRKNPLISVVMAVYNGENCIKPTIESILNQTFKDFELLIVNDCSNDRTADVIESFKDHRIILHNNEENLKQTKSLNIGLKMARGKYIARTDAGDVSLPGRLEKQVEYLKNHPDITVIGTSGYRFNERGKIIDVVHMPESQLGMLQMILYASPIIHISVLMDREKILNLGGYDENYEIAADYELWSRLMQNNCSMANIREVLVGYMASSESYGAINLQGTSKNEPDRIIQSNVNKFTKLSMSFNQATNIRKLFNANINEMSLYEITTTENLFINMYNSINGSKDEANWFLIRKYLKYALQNIRNPKDKSKLQHIIKFIFFKIGCLFNRNILKANLFQINQNLIWRNKKNIPTVPIKT